jgi:hypothetical protein
VLSRFLDNTVTLTQCIQLVTLLASNCSKNTFW